MKNKSLIGLVLLILGSMLPIACGTMPPTSPSIPSVTDTPTFTYTAVNTATPTNTATKTVTSTPTKTNTPTPTSTSTIAYPVGTHTISSGVNPPVSFNLTNGGATTANYQIALYPYPDTGNVYQDVGIGPIASGSGGSDTITIPSAGNYFVYVRAYISGSYVLIGWAPMYIAPGYSISGTIYSSSGILAGITSNSSCFGCGLP
jgi:hypothetical protein